MFRLKVALTLVVLFSVQAIVTYFAFQSTVTTTVLEDTDIALQRSATMVEQAHRIDQYSLVEKSRFVANRNTIRRAMVADYEGDAEYNRHVEMHKQLETELLRFQQQGRRLEGQRNLDLPLLHRRPDTQELFMALDETGRGVATLGRDLAHWMGDNVAQDFPVVLEVMENNQAKIDIWNWSFQASEEGQLYTVAIAPIRHPDRDETVGVIVLGNLINDGFANRDQALIASGHEILSDEQIQLEGRQKVQTPEVLFFRGDRIRSSTLNSRGQQQVRNTLFEEMKVQEYSAELAEKIIDLKIDENEYRAIVRFFTGQEGEAEAAGVVLLTNRAAALAPVTSAQNNLLFLTFLFLVLALVSFFGFLMLFLKPFEQLEDGVQTIISGDKDHTFAAIPSNPVADGLAHHLNLLSAYLQGNPMPDDDGSSADWGEMGGEGSPGQEAKSSLMGVPLGLGRKKKKAETETDSAEASETEKV